MQIIKITFSTIALLLLLLSEPRVLAQTSGSVSGHLSDPVGASLGQADVTLTNVGMNTERITKSTDVGDYTFTAIPPGIYTLRVKRSGFKTTQSDNFEVQVQQSVRLDLRCRSAR